MIARKFWDDNAEHSSVEHDGSMKRIFTASDEVNVRFPSGSKPFLLNRELFD